MKKSSLYAGILYIVLFVPIIVSYVISMVQRATIGANFYIKTSDLRLSNGLALGVTVILALVAIIVGWKMEQGVLWYAIGIFVATIGLLLPMNESAFFIENNVLAMIMVGCYVIGVVGNVVREWRR